MEKMIWAAAYGAAFSERWRGSANAAGCIDVYARECADAAAGEYRKRFATPTEKLIRTARGD